MRITVRVRKNIRTEIGRNQNKNRKKEGIINNLRKM